MRIKMEEKKMEKIRKAGTAKKIMATAMAVGMLAASTLTAYAADQSGSMKVQYTKVRNSSFVLSIPESVTLQVSSEVNKQVGVSSINVEPDEKVQIKVSDGIENGKVILTDSGNTSKTVSSKVSLTSNNTGNGINIDDVVAEFEGNSTIATREGTLYFSSVGAGIAAGEYSGVITFEASIVMK